MSTFDAVLSNAAREFLSSLDVADRVAFGFVLEDLMVDPYPDGVSKVALDFFPYNAGTIGASVGEFWLTYTFLNSTTIGIAGLYWNPDSPRRGGELYEA